MHLPILYKIAVTKAAIGLRFKYNMNKNKWINKNNLTYIGIFLNILLNIFKKYFLISLLKCFLNKSFNMCL